MRSSFTRHRKFHPFGSPASEVCLRRDRGRAGPLSALRHLLVRLSPGVRTTLRFVLPVKSEVNYSLRDDLRKNWRLIAWAFVVGAYCGYVFGWLFATVVLVVTEGRVPSLFFWE